MILGLRVRTKNNLVLGNIRELDGVQVQSVYLIYTRLLVYITLILVYSKGHAYYMPLTYAYEKTLLFQNLLCPFVICDCVTLTCDCHM